jgi:hypothetical protein
MTGQPADPPIASEVPRRPPGRSSRWTSFVAEPPVDGKPVRGLHEQGNPRHRVRVEHDAHTLFIHLSDEEGDGWTTMVIDRPTRQWTVSQALRQKDAARDGFDRLYGEDD